MNKLKFCEKCKNYTLKSTHCNLPTIKAGYKFLRIKSISLENFHFPK